MPCHDDLESLLKQAHITLAAAGAGLVKIKSAYFDETLCNEKDSRLIALAYLAGKAAVR